MSNTPYKPFAPANFHDFVGDAIATAPPPLQQVAPAAGTQAQPFTITEESLRNATLPPRQPYSFNISDPYSVAKRYMSPAWGSSGYVGNSSEEFNAERQGRGSKWINGLAKFTGNGLTTFVSGTAGLLDGVYEVGRSIVSPKGLDFSKLFDNPVDRGMQNLSNWQEYQFPHYQTQRELNASVGSTDNWATTNFWANGLLKNLGFAAGALLTGELGAAALARVPAITEFALAANKLLATGDVARSAKLMEQAMGMGLIDDVAKANIIKEIAINPVNAAAKLDELGVSAERVAAVHNFDQNFRTAFNKYAISTLGAIGESNMEAIQGKQSIRDQLTQDYQSKHNGELPDAQAKEEIEARAQQGSNWRWFFNLITLSVTNNIQFPKLLSNEVKQQMGAYSREAQDIVAIDIKGKMAGRIAKGNQEYATSASLEAAERSRIMRVINPVYQFVKNPIAVSEAVEEGLQYAYEKGTESYEQMKYDHKAASLYHEIVSTGMYKVFHDKEGIESMIFGGLTGKLMDLVLGGRERKALKKNTEELLTAVNSKEFTITKDLAGVAGQEKVLRTSNSEYIDEQTEANIRQGAIISETNKAVANGDIERSRSLDSDFLMNVALPRIQFGRKDMLKQELTQYKNMPFEEAKAHLHLTDDITKEDLDKAIDKRVRQVNTLSTLNDFVYASLGRIDPKTGAPKYLQPQLHGMLYDLFKISDLDERFDKLTDQIQTATGVDLGILTDYVKRKMAEPKAEGEEAQDLDTIRTTIAKQVKDAVRNDPTKELDAKKISIFDKLRDLETIMNDRERHVRGYERRRNLTADKVEEMTKKNLDPKNLSLQDLENYEEIHQYPMLLDQVQGTTNARRIAVELSRALVKLDRGDHEAVGKHLAQVEALLADKRAFLLKEDIQHFRSVVDTIKDRVFEQTKASIPTSDPPDDFLNMPRKDALQYAEQIPIEVQIGDAPPGITEEHADYLTRVAELYKQNTAYLKPIEDAITTLENRGEPQTPKISDIRRTIADGFMAGYDEVANAMSNEDNAEYRDEDQIENLIHTIEWMQKLYAQRTELLATPAFKGFMDMLANRLKELKEWLEIVKKRNESILKDDKEFYRNRTHAQWAALGIDITKDMPVATAATAATATEPVMTPEDKAAMDKEMADLDKTRSDALAALNEPVPIEFISTDLDKVIGSQLVTSPLAGGETIEQPITVRGEQMEIEKEYEAYKELLKCTT